MKLRTALLFQAGNYVGREYFRALSAADRRPDLAITVGTFKPGSVEIERQRTGGRWNPPTIEAVDASFDRLDDDRLVDLLTSRGIDVAIQGGVGIIKPRLIATPRLGILNVHPGRLPQYRGCSCPEWAVLHGEPVYATAHFIDAGVDTGPVVCSLPYRVDPSWSYEDFRAYLYAHCAAVLLEAMRRLEASDDPSRLAVPQEAAGAQYHQPMSAPDLASVKSRFPLR
jgi:hypothetical protein